MQKFSWMDDETAGQFEAEFEALEEDQAFLEQFYGVSMLLEAIGNAEDEEVAFEDEEYLAS